MNAHSAVCVSRLMDVDVHSGRPEGALFMPILLLRHDRLHVMAGLSEEPPVYHRYSDVSCDIVQKLDGIMPEIIITITFNNIIIINHCDSVQSLHRHHHHHYL